MIVEDDEEWQNVLQDPLESLGLKIAVAKNRTEAKQLLDLENYDIVIVDIQIGDEEDDIAKSKTTVFIAYIRQYYPNTICVIITGYGTLGFAIDAFRHLGIADFYEKGDFKVMEFMNNIRGLLSRAPSAPLTNPDSNPPLSKDRILSIELERRRRELINHINSCRKDSDDVLSTIRNKRIAAKGNKTDSKDDEWISDQRKRLNERYRNALAKINEINSLDETEVMQLWLEKECNAWLSISVD
jgi:ActR/RegA family two-component response regulator